MQHIQAVNLVIEKSFLTPEKLLTWFVFRLLNDVITASEVVA
jgi:hypothetical protein